MRTSDSGPGNSCLLIISLLASITCPALAQNPAKDVDTAEVPRTSPGSPDSHITHSQRLDEAWSMLSTAVASPGHLDTRIQGLAALGTLGSNLRSSKLISGAMADPNMDIRTAAILSAGESKDRNLTTDLRSLLDDKEPEVAFAAATTLWSMGDRSGEDILLAVIDGERSATPGAVNGARHSVARDLHHPATLARIGAMQGASLLLGPFGFGLTAVEYMRKNGGDSARVAAISQIAQYKTGPIRAALIAALNDKDPAVRAAAAKALGTYHDPTISDPLYNLFTDPKQPVRLTAAAAYINASEDSGIGSRPRTRRKK